MIVAQHFVRAHGEIEMIATSEMSSRDSQTTHFNLGKIDKTARVDLSATA